MKYFSLLLISTLGFAANSSDYADPAGRTAIYRSYKLAPNQKLVLNLEVGRKCSDMNKEQLTIEDFESSKNLNSSSLEKNDTIRVMHYYVETFSPCDGNVIGKISKQLSIGPFKDSTHIKLTTSENVNVIKL